MITFVLDTDSVTFQQANRPAMMRRLALVEAGTVATTVVTMYEQLRGRLAAINRQQDDAALQLAFQRFAQTHQYYCRVPVLPFDAAAAAMLRQLIDQGLRIGAQDLRIAAITLANGATLVTSNRRHFDQVPGLRVEDWNRPDV